MNKYALRQTPLAVAIGCVIASGSLHAATITVNTADDPGSVTACSLRSAIESANTGLAVDGCESGTSGADEIVFDQSLAGSTITLGSSLTIENSLTINGPGSDQLTIGDPEYSGSSLDGIFRVDFSSYPEQALVIRGLRLEGSDASGSGGAIRMRVPDVFYTADLLLEDVVITNNYAVSGGGAVAFATGYCGGLTIRDSVISNNWADGRGGAIAFDGGYGCELSIENSVLSFNSSDSYGGGAISAIAYDYEDVRVSISDNSLLAFNYGRYFGGGLSVEAYSGGTNVSVTNSQLIGNRARYVGGALGVWAPRAYDSPDTHVKIDSSLIRGNSTTAGYGGGGIYAWVDNYDGSYAASVSITDSIVSNNSNHGDGGGAFLYLIDTELSVSGTRFEGNSGRDGGGLLVESESSAGDVGVLTISDSQFVDNMAYGAGGGLLLDGEAGVLIDRALISGNLAGYMGAAVVLGDEVIMRNSEISGNFSMTYPAALVIGEASVELENSTISGNESRVEAGGLFVAGESVSARFLTVANNVGLNGSGKYPESFGLMMYAGMYADSCTIDSSLIALNSGPSGPLDLYAPDCGVSWSLIGDTTNGSYVDAGNNLVDVNPVIGPLADNGGPTRTHALGATSPAINRGNPAFIAPPDFDQRGPGFPRIFGGLVDIGAFELQGEAVDLIFSDRFEEL